MIKLILLSIKEKAGVKKAAAKEHVRRHKKKYISMAAILTMVFVAKMTWLFIDIGKSFASTPAITSISPYLGELQANDGSFTGPNPNIVINFSEAMDANTITTDSFRVTSESGPVTGSVAYSTGTNDYGQPYYRATFTPSTPFAFGTQFVIHLNTAASGSPILSSEAVPIDPNFGPDPVEYMSVFFTMGPLGSPIVHETSPVRGASNVQINEPIRANFQESMNWATLNTDSFKLYDETGGELGMGAYVTGTVESDYSGNGAKFIPSSPLIPNKTYSAILQSGIANESNSFMPNSYNWTFTTVPVDSTPPNIDEVMTNPAPNSGFIDYTRNGLSVYFQNGPIDPSLITNSNIVLTGPGGVITPYSLNFSYDSQILSLILSDPGSPTTVLQQYSTYTLTFSNIHDIQENSLSGTTSYSFRTTEALPDVIRPYVTTHTPDSGATGVGIHSSVVVNFSESINPNTLTTLDFTVAPTLGGPNIASSVTTSNSDQTATLLAPIEGYAYSTQYTVTLTPGNILDTHALPLEEAGASWTFTTESAPPGTPPEIVSHSNFPVDVATDVSLDTTVYVTFSEAMNTINSSQFTLTPTGGAPIDATVSLNGDSTIATLTPSSNLSPNTIYTATIQGADNHPGTAVTSLTSTQLANDYTWSFTTTSRVSFLSTYYEGFFPTINGAVNAISVSDNKIVVGGEFTSVNSQAQNGIVFFEAGQGSATAAPWNPLDSGAVVNAVYQYQDTLYVAGNFTITVDNVVVRKNLAAFDMSDSGQGALSTWDPGLVDQTVKTIAGTTFGDLFIGGDFGTVGATTCPKFAYFASSDASKYCLSSEIPNGSVNTIAIKEGGSGFFIGGDFTSISGTQYGHLAFISTNDGPPTLTDWNPNLNGSVKSLTTTGSSTILTGTSNLLVGGSFTPNYFVTYNISDLQNISIDSNFSPQFNNEVDAIKTANAEIYIGGKFTSVNTDSFHAGAASFKTSDGSIESWHPTFSTTNWVKTLYVDSGAILAGGDFADQNYLSLHVAGNDPHIQVTDKSPAANATNIALDSTISITFDADIESSTVNPDSFYISHLDNGVVYAPGTISVSGPTITFTPEGNQLNHDTDYTVFITTGVRSTDGNSLSTTYSWTFSTVAGDNGGGGGDTYTHVSFSNTPIAPWVTTDGTVNTIAFGENGMSYLGGHFSNVTIGGQTYERKNLFALSEGTVMADWNPGINRIGTVNSIALFGSDVIVGGNFIYGSGSVPPVIRRNIAAFVAPINATSTSSLDSSFNPGNPNNTVKTIAVYHNETVFAGGSFTSVNGNSSCMALFQYRTDTGLGCSNTTGLSALRANGDVNALTVMSDNNLGLQALLIGGAFQQIDGTSRNLAGALTWSEAAHEFSLASWNPQLTGTSVDAVLIDNANLIFYLGGTFTSSGETSRNGLAAYVSDNPGSAHLDMNWDPHLGGGDGSANVYALANGNTTSIYVGGNFHSVGGNDQGGGSNRTGLASFERADGSTATGVAESWNPTFSNNAVVRTIAVSTDNLVAGGDFADQGYLSIFSPGSDSNSVTFSSTKYPSWFTTDGEINSIITGQDGTIYIGGSFSHVIDSNLESQERHGLAAVNGDTLSSWNPGLDSGAVVNTLGFIDSNIMVGGSFTYGTNERINLASFALSDGTVDSVFNPGEVHGIVRTIYGLGDFVFVGGDFTQVGENSNCHYILTYKASDGVSCSDRAAQFADLATNGPVYSLTGIDIGANGGGILLAGGTFTQAGGSTHNLIAAWDVNDGFYINAWDPLITGAPESSVNTIAVKDYTIYVGGSFSHSGDTVRHNIAAFDASQQGAPLDTSWNPDVNGTVKTIYIANTAVYVGGAFAGVNGLESRSGAASFEQADGSATGTAESWHPTFSNTGTVNSLYVNSEAIIAGGAFASQGYLAAFIPGEDNGGSGTENVYVNSSWTSSENAGGHTWGVDAFSNITDAIAAVSAGGNIYATGLWWGQDNGPTSEQIPEGDYEIFYRPFCKNLSCDRLSSREIDASDLSSLFTGGTVTPTFAEGSSALTSIIAATFDEDTQINLSITGGNISISLPLGTVITTVEGESQIFNASLFGASSQLVTAFSGLGSIDPVGAFEWGIPNLGLQFSQAITIDMYVGSSFNGQTLTLKRSTSTTSGWTDNGLGGLNGAADGTCIVADATCSFTTTLASYYVAGVSTSNESSSTTSTGGGSLPSHIKAPKTTKSKISQTVKDINGHWAQTYIEDLYDKKVISGKDSTHFFPNDLLSRAELTKIAVNMYKLPLNKKSLFPISFKDVKKEDWYSPYLQSAYDKGIIKGYKDNTFLPNSPITRAEVIKIILSAAGIKLPEPTTEPKFADVKKEDWFAKYAEYAISNKLLNSYPDNTFRQDLAITRAEAAKVASLMLKKKPAPRK